MDIFLIILKNGHFLNDQIGENMSIETEVVLLDYNEVLDSFITLVNDG